MDIDDLRGLYHQDYDPYQETNELQKGSGFLITSGIFHEINEKDPGLIKMEKAYATDGRRLRMLCPGLFEYLGRKAKWDIEFAYDICGQALLEAAQCLHLVSSMT
jgi:hypothetical protein